MKRVFLLLTLLLVQAITWAQSLTPKTVQSDWFIKRWAAGATAVGQQLPIMPAAPGIKVAEVYLDPSWKKSTVAIYGSDNLLDGYPTRYDLKANALEFNINKEVKVLEARRVKAMVWLDSLTNIPHNFINGKEYTVNGIPLNSLLEVLTEGKMTLYKEYRYWIKKPDFNPALNAGSVDERIYKEFAYYYANGVEKALVRVPEKKKAFPAIFGDKAESVKGYLKSQGLSIDKDDDLVRVFEYYNSLQ